MADPVPAPGLEPSHIPGPLRVELERQGGPSRRLLVYVALDVERAATRKAATMARDPVSRQGLLDHAVELDRVAAMIQAALTNAARARGDLDASMFDRPRRK